MQKNTLIGALVGFVVGILFTSIVAWTMAPGMMMIESHSKLGFDDTIQAIQDNAAAQGWVVPNVMRLDKSVADHGYDVRPVAVIELCRPDLAAKILAEDDARLVSSLMPCRVAVYENSNGDVILSRMNTGLMSQMFGGLVTEVMSEATAQTEQIFAPLEK
ncbi:MAG: hypothetical protein B6242_09515 [Anaerolineaceae bacterium 4572_78]|nr:MAG: hypothetical protein B6242_09515 [Anaerolineaceae bacterium 4572_78]